MRKIAVLVITLSAFLLGGAITHVHAQEFDVKIDREYTVNPDASMHVKETHTITNNSSNLLISKSNQESFQIAVIGDDKKKLTDSVATAVVKADGNTQTYTSDVQDKFSELKVNYPKELRRNQTLTFILEYTNFGLLQNVGALYDIYAPGFVKDFQFVKGNTKVSYTTVFRISDQLSAENFVIPTPASKETSNGFSIYSFSQESLLGKTIWIQRGRTQFYQFKIVQHAQATDDHDTGYLNEYRVILPKDVDEGEVTQTVYFTKISPEPFQVVNDSEGNLIGYFKVPTHTDVDITVEGFASVSKKDLQVGESNSGNLNGYDAQLVAGYTKAAQFWEVDAPQIQTLAKQLEEGNQNVFDIVAKTYQHVVDTINYSEVKRFGLNERQGALKTLENGSGVCMEYSDLFLTLSRAQGIPARAAFGYGYDSRLPVNGAEAHQWVQVFMPGLGKWVSVDVTWGESGPALIGGDLNHFYTHTASTDPNTPPMVERISYGSNVDLPAPQFQFTAEGKLADITQAMTGDQLLKKYPKSTTITIQDQLNSFGNDLRYLIDQASSKDKGQVVTTCGVALSIIAIVFLGIYSLLSARKNKKHNTASGPAAPL
jgi:hypothetical protein